MRTKTCSRRTAAAKADLGLRKGQAKGELLGRRVIG